MSDYDYAAKMSEIRQTNADTISNYFSKMSSSSTKKETSAFSGVMDNLNDYALIKNGGYSKLMKAYYKNVSESNADAEMDSTKSLVMTKNDAKSLKTATKELNDFSFEKKTVTTKDDQGKETTKTDYDWDGLLKKAKDFVKSYNTMLDTVDDLNSSSVLKKAVQMTKVTSSSRDLLSDIGISIGSDNRLSIDESNFKNADMNKVKVAFKGQNSIASQIGYKATQLYNLSANAAMTQTNGGNRVYTQAGNYQDITSSTLYDSLL